MSQAHGFTLLSVLNSASVSSPLTYGRQSADLARLHISVGSYQSSILLDAKPINTSVRYEVKQTNRQRKYFGPSLTGHTWYADKECYLHVHLSNTTIFKTDSCLNRQVQADHCVLLCYKILCPCYNLGIPIDENNAWVFFRSHFCLDK